MLGVEVQAMSAYRAQLFLGVFGWVVPFAFMALWRSAAGSSPVAGITGAQFTTYYVGILVTTTAAIGSGMIGGLSALIHSGQLSASLLRPVNPLLALSARGLAQRGYRLLPLFLVAPLVVVVGDGQLSSDWSQVVLAPAVAVMGFVVAGYLAAIVATLSFWMTKAGGVQGLLQGLEWLAGGVAAPVALLPGPWDVIVRHTPFWLSLGAPAEMVAGISKFGVPQVLEMVAWGGALHIVLTLCWRRGIRQYEAVGT